MNFDRDTIFSVWAPPGALWSDWVKPVLFAHIGRPNVIGPERLHDLLAAHLRSVERLDLRWLPRATGETALVIDLPIDAAVWVGYACARLGYRPVPLYNACPDPFSDRYVPPALAPQSEDSEASAPQSGPRPLDYERPAADVRPVWRSPAPAVEVAPILAALEFLAPHLWELRVPQDAPPAFLLDAHRRGSTRSVTPGMFDNRSVSFPTDFPSADLLLHRGVRRAVLVQESRDQPDADLAHTLRRWQDRQIALECKRLDDGAAPKPLIVAKPRWYRSLWHRVSIAAGMRRNPLGGFGGMLAEPSTG